MSSLLTDLPFLEILLSLGKGYSHTQRFHYQRIEEGQVVNLAVTSGIRVLGKVGANFVA